MRWLLLCCLLLSPTGAWADAAYSAHILEHGDPAQWHEAVEGSFAKQGRLAWKSLAVILPRVEQMVPKTRQLVAQGLQYRTSDPRALKVLSILVYDSNQPVRKAAIKSLLTGESEEVAQLLEKLGPQDGLPAWELKRKVNSIRSRLAEGKLPVQPKSAPGSPIWHKIIRTLAVLLCGITGLLLVLWGNRLINLRRLLNNTPRSTIRSVAMGTHALQGEVQPWNNRLLTHPMSGEPCVYYAGADRVNPEHRFWLVDDTGRILIEPVGAILLSEDAVLLPGGKVQLVGDIRHSTHKRAEQVVAKRREPRHHLEVAFHFLLNQFFGNLFRDSSSRALFSDPSRLFWIWDDLGSAPFTSRWQTVSLFSSVVAAGGWLVLVMIGCLYLL